MNLIQYRNRMNCLFYGSDKKTLCALRLIILLKRKNSVRHDQQEINKFKGEWAMQFNAIIEKDEEGYYAYVPALKGCVSQGDTFEEIQINIKEAIELYIEDLREWLNLKLII